MNRFLRGFSIFVAVLHIVGIILVFCRMATGFEYSNDYDITVVLPLTIIINVKLLIAAFLLLKGAIEKKPGYFLYWIIYTCVLNILFTLWVVYLLINLGSVGEDAEGVYSILLSVSIGLTVIVWIKWTLVLLCYQDLKKNSMDNYPYSKFKTDSIPSTI